jgi:hypothetical protein
MDEIESIYATEAVAPEPTQKDDNQANTYEGPNEDPAEQVPGFETKARK